MYMKRLKVKLNKMMISKFVQITFFVLWKYLKLKETELSTVVLKAITNFQTLKVGFQDASLD